MFKGVRPRERKRKKFLITPGGVVLRRSSGSSPRADFKHYKGGTRREKIYSYNLAAGTPAGNWNT
eukprot:6453814-Pyramimonas_sp.AAC.1